MAHSMSVTIPSAPTHTVVPIQAPQMWCPRRVVCSRTIWCPGLSLPLYSGVSECHSTDPFLRFSDFSPSPHKLACPDCPSLCILLLVSIIACSSSFSVLTCFSRHVALFLLCIDLPSVGTPHDMSTPYFLALFPCPDLPSIGAFGGCPLFIRFFSVVTPDERSVLLFERGSGQVTESNVQVWTTH